MTRNRKNNTPSIVQALYEAQKIAFAPFVFQAAVAARRLGILKTLSESDSPLTQEVAAEKTNLTPYAVRVVCELLASAGVLSGNASEGFALTKTGECLLFDNMTEVNLNFTADVCYKGLAHLPDALQEGRPAGLSELGPWSTIYPALSELPGKAKSSWFGFDHFYSDGAFLACAQWIDENLSPETLFDVGGNTGRFVSVCLRRMQNLSAVIVDLPQQCALARSNPENADVLSRLDTAEVNWLDPAALPKTQKKADLVWMSQFLDCFSPAEAVSILKRMVPFLKEGGKIAVLECLWDRQPNPAGELSLLATSLYFTAMANGNSRFFSQGDLEQILAEAGLEVEKRIDGLGLAHSLFVCSPKKGA